MGDFLIITDSAELIIVYKNIKFLDINGLMD